MITVTQAETVLKDIYKDLLVDKIQNCTPLFKIIPFKQTDVYNGVVRKLCQVKSLSSSVDECYVTAITPLKTVNIPLRVPVSSLQSADSDEKSFVNILDAEAKRAVDYARLYFAKTLYGTTRTNLTSIVMNIGNTVSVENDNLYIKGMAVDILNYDTDEVLYNNLVITDVGVDENDYTAITVSGVEITEDLSDGGTYIVREHGTSEDTEISGLWKVFSDSDTLYNINRDYDQWGRFSVWEVDGLLDTSNFSKYIDKGGSNAWQDFNAVAVLPLNCLRAFTSFLTDNDVPFTYKMSDGVKEVEYQGVRLYGTIFYPNDGFMLNPNDFAFYTDVGWHWSQDAGGNILTLDSENNCYVANLTINMELVCDKPYSQLKMTGIRTAA